MLTKASGSRPEKNRKFRLDMTQLKWTILIVCLFFGINPDSCYSTENGNFYVPN